ncbi:MAG: phytoene desaturase [Candidatus Kapaibacterium sp.]|nr:MAG: phytoene desaturase [Candidatus Kapabacteria bacterium]
MKKLIVVGAGLGGLALALRAASAGWSVHVVERYRTPGGKMNRLVQDGYTFDTGPSLITLPEIFTGLFDECHVDRSELKFHRLLPLTLYRFSDGSSIAYPSSLADLAQTLEKFESDKGRGFWRLISTGAKLMELSRRTFFRTTPRELPSVSEALQMLSALRWMPIRNAWGNYANAVERNLASHYLQRIFLRYPTYVGSSPYRCPATLLVVPYLEFALGGWYPEGGLYRIVELIVDALCARGAIISTSTHVRRILHRNGRVYGVELECGDVLEADVVAFNGDATVAHQLLGSGQPALKRIERSMSGVVFLVGLKSRLPEDVFHHTIAFSHDYRKEFAELFDERKFPTDPTVYLNVTSKTDPATAPPGGETLFIMANAPAIDGAKWRHLEPMLWERICRTLSRCGIEIPESQIAVRLALTPEDFEQRYAMPGGSIYGWASHSYRTAFVRPPLRDRRIQGLYYVGGSTHPGGGTPMVLISAKLVFNLMQRHEVHT